VSRSNSLIVRNPLMKLASARKLIALLEANPELRDHFRALLKDLRVECNDLAQKSWRKNKGPMAAYWMAARAYVGHCARLK
jgi:hypothetical protein